MFCFPSPVYSVDPSNGAVGVGEATNYFYDGRGDLVETVDPDGLVTRSTYDGAGRLVMTSESGDDSQTLLSDGSFESPALSSGTSQYNPTGSSWSFIGTSGIESNGSGWDAAPASDGVQAAFLQNSGSEISQSLALSAGTYTLTFDAAQRSQYGVLPIEVDVDGVAVALVTPSSTSFSSYSVSITIEGTGRHSISFVGTGGDSIDYDSFIDNVTLESNTAAPKCIIPAPSDPITVLSQTQYVYDGDGNVIETIESDRLPTDSPTATGQLGDANGNSGPAARVSYTASYYDAADRDVADVNVGTNGGTAWTRPSGVPADSASILVTSYTYDAAGDLSTMTDPAGLVTAYTSDALGRLTQEVDDYTNGVPTDSSNQTTTYTYDGDNNLTSETAVMPAGEASQTTDYLYGVSTSTGSAIDDNDLLYQVQYPDPTTGAASGSQAETYSYDALGDTLTYTDRNGTTHAYSYDALDRLTTDAITHFGTGVDQTVASIGYSYNDAGLLAGATSYSASGNVLNQVQESYDGLGNTTGDAQSHSGSVSGSTPSVNYTYNQSTGELESMQYPNGRTLNYGYTDVGQISSISDSSGTLASYSYLGLDTPISTTYGNGVSETTTLNSLGEVAEEKYTNASGTAIDDISYGYDNDGNVLYEQNNVLPGQSQLFTYDGLNRLTSYSQGTLNSSKTGMTSTSASESWQLDALGNWKSSTTNGTTTTRTNNAQNQATQIGTATLGYDADGNTTTDQTGQQYVYDAWNRLVTVKNASGQTIASYGYDALGRRITQTENGTTTDLYYSTNWQVVEERQGSTTTTQYVWSPFYVDQLIERDDQPSGGTLTRRLYAEQDADHNVTSITNSSGNVVERYSYDPYGNFTVENADGTTRGNGTASASSYGWTVLHQGLMLDRVSGVYLERTREYDASTGTFFQQDLARYVDGLNRYLDDEANPIDTADPFGTAGHKTNKRPSNWDKHSSKRSGGKEKKDQKMPYSPKGGKNKNLNKREDCPIEDALRSLNDRIANPPPPIYIGPADNPFKNDNRDVYPLGPSSLPFDPNEAPPVLIDNGPGAPDSGFEFPQINIPVPPLDSPWGGVILILLLIAGSPVGA